MGKVQKIETWMIRGLETMSFEKEFEEACLGAGEREVLDLRRKSEGR